MASRCCDGEQELCVLMAVPSHGGSVTLNDCEFVALAMTLGVPLVSMDAKLLKAFPGHAVALSQPSA
jgi:predicted nucleic acid-binding protein